MTVEPPTGESVDSFFASMKSQFSDLEWCVCALFCRSVCWPLLCARLLKPRYRTCSEWAMDLAVISNVRKRSHASCDFKGKHI